MRRLFAFLCAALTAQGASAVFTKFLRQSGHGMDRGSWDRDSGFDRHSGSQIAQAGSRRCVA